MVPGLTPDSRYVNNHITLAQNPRWQNPAGNGPRPAPHSPQVAAANFAPMGAMATSDEGAEAEPAWPADNPAMGNLGNGWQTFPGEGPATGYNIDPTGMFAFADQEQNFQLPAGSPQGPPLA